MNEYTYKIPLGQDGKPSKLVIFRSDMVWIPFDEDNADYQQYLVDTDGGLPLPEKTKEDK